MHLWQPPNHASVAQQGNGDRQIPGTAIDASGRYQGEEEETISSHHPEQSPVSGSTGPGGKELPGA